MLKHNPLKPNQLEISFLEPEGFHLAIQPAADGERIAQQAAQKAADQQQAEQKQSLLI